MGELNKATVENRRNLLSDAVTNGWVTDFDLDSNEVFIERWSEAHERFVTFRHGFTMTDTAVTIDEEGTEVIRTVEFKEVEHMSDHEPLTKSVLMKILDKVLGKGKDNTRALIKQFNEDEMVAIEPLYIAANEVDGQGDTISLEDTHGMVDSLNKAIGDGRLQSGLFHKHKTDSFTIEKAWVNEVACTIGETEIPAGQPIAQVKFHNVDAWELRKNGELSGLSIGARFTDAEDLT